ncbi:MAG: helicase HerA-like domain-containing protein [Gemmatimonadales bacterium]|nr:helicase HerA-like domain-containing protein [Gemmatimonadales bacterium]
MNAEFLASVREAFPTSDALILGAPMHEGAIHPEPLVRLPFGMLNRHGLIAGATGTGKTKTLQLLAEQMSAAGIPVFVADLKGDLSGLATAGQPHPKIDERAAATGHPWAPTSYPVEFLSLTGHNGAQLRATVSSFGPLLLAKVLGLNETQTSVLTLVFKYCDDQGLLLLDFSDLRAVFQYLSGEGAGELKEYGGMARQTVGVLLREMVELEQQGAEAFFGEPEFDLADLMQLDRDGRGIISVLELADIQDKPALFSTFMMWMLARLYQNLPEVGDQARPKLVFFFDEAHLLFDGASEAFLTQVEQVVRLIRSKGVGIFFVTQSPKDIPADILGQLGHRVQHALRAFTPDDEKALRAAARTFPKTPFYDVQELLTSVGTGEAVVTTLTPKGTPTATVATHLVAPTASMSPLDAASMSASLERSRQVKFYARTVDRESARELLASRVEEAASAAAAAKAEAAIGVEDRQPRARSATRRAEPDAMDRILKSPGARTAQTMIVRAVMGVLLGGLTGRRR